MQYANSNWLSCFRVCILHEVDDGAEEEAGCMHGGGH